ncbi:hypothetical protein [Microvirga massiliensis]|uniref:hypothetical protein n=1 Tax=Microvirga massiliensis TaxID=1033741 RepID=UPI000AE64FEA|nr:hypothetical protein [Microvirga massiliensis]
MGDRILLPWRDNGDRYLVAVVANRLAAQGLGVRVRTGSDARSNAGDYLLPDADQARHLLHRLGLQCRPAGSDAAGADLAVAFPRIAIVAGHGSAYPYYAYYAHCLAALGYTFDVVDGPELAAGSLDDVDLLVLPGGFAIWGLDRCEAVSGADQAVRHFLAKGGAAIGSCGGAYYLSQGRPGWLGLAPASPRYTHEYLRSGAGIVSVTLEPGPIAIGCAPTVEVPYYHGPIYEAVRAPAETAGRFRSLSMPAHMPINNPLDPDRFDSELAGKPAILTVQSNDGRAVLFSPHPEMGDLVRKYVSIGSYIARYLPIRGLKTMEETLDFYEPNDAPAFRLVLNAIQHLCTGARAGVEPLNSADRSTNERDVVLDLAIRRLGEIRTGGHPLEPLLMREVRRLEDLARSLHEASPVLTTRGALRVLSDAVSALSSDAWGERDVIQQLLDLELPLRFIEVSARCAQVDAVVQESRVSA